MSDPSGAATGTSYTVSVALLVVGFFFIPAVLVALRPIGLLSLAAAIACSLLCAGAAWLSWRKYSRLSIPSILPLRRAAR